MAKLIQKRYPVIPDNQLARRIQSKRIRMCGAQPPTNRVGLGGRSLPNIIFLSGSVEVPNALRMLTQNRPYLKNLKSQNYYIWMKIRFRVLHITLDNFFFQKILRTLNDHISENKNPRNWKIDFSFVSEHYATIWSEKNQLFLKGRGGKGN